MKVYAGYDPVSGKRHYLGEVVPTGPRAKAEAERARTRLLHQVDERRNPKTRATVNQLLDRCLETLDVEVRGPVAAQARSPGPARRLRSF